MTRRRSSAPAAAVALALITMACSSLDPIEPGVCGNGVVEPELGEDCDRPGAACGGPTTAHACRLLCQTDAECPAAAACGDDGVCRVPDGALTASASVSFATRFVLVGDVDGAGDPDLVGVDDVRLDLRRGDDGAGFVALPATPNLPMLSTPRLGDVTGDGRADLVTSVGVGINLFTGAADASFEPTLQPTITYPAHGAVATARIPYADAGGDHVQLLLATTVNPSVSCPLPLGCPILSMEDAGLGLVAGRRLANLVDGRLAWARRPAAASDSPFEITAALLFRDAGVGTDPGVVDLYRVRVVPTASRPRIEYLATVTIAGAGSAVATGVALGDLDGDGLADLIVDLRGAVGADETLVGAGRADGTFAPLVAMRVAPLRADGSLGPAVAVARGLGWQDVDDDGVVDRLGFDHVDKLVCPPATRWNCAGATVLVSQDGWTALDTGDVNGDGKTDVVGIRQLANTVDVYFGTSTFGAWNPAPFVLSTPVKGLRIGDFDGNGVDDIGLMATPADDDPDRVDLEVAFGRVAAPPDPPIRMGTIARPVAIEVVRATTLDNNDAIDDLLVFRDAGTQLELAFVMGATSQRMASPLIPAAEPLDGDGDDVFTAVPAVLMLPGGDGNPGALAALATALRVFPDAGPGDPPFEIVSSSVRFLSVGAGGELVETRRVPLIAPDFDTLFATWAVATAPGQAPRAIGADPGGRVVAVPITGCPADCQASAPENLQAAGDAPDLVAVLDLDRAGLPEVAIVTTSGRQSRLALWRGAAGTAETLMAPTDVRWTAVTALETDRTRPRTLVLADATGDLYVAAPDDAGHYPAAVLAATTGLLATPVAAPIALHAVDVDDDGLDDLVVTSGPEPQRPQTVTIYTQGAAPGGAGLAAGEGQ